MHSANRYPLIRVLIDGDPSSPAPLSWWAGEPGALEDHGHACVDALPAAERLEWLIHPAHTGLHTLTLPRQSPAKLRALLPHALDDELLAPVDTLHLALRANTDGRVDVRSIDKAWLTAWLQHFAATQRTPAAAWALADLLPSDQGALQLSIEPGALLRDDNGDTVWLDDASLLATLAGDASALDLDSLALQACDGVNLLQGDLTPRTAPKLDWRLWRHAGTLLGVALALWLIGNVAHWWQLRQSVDAARQALRQSYAAAFPGEPIVDPALQLASKLRQSGSKADTLTARLQRLENAGIGAGAISRITYQNGRLTLELNTAAADAAAAQLAAAGETITREPAGADRVRLQW
ncbi:type II secretion system protein GspL [Jeongeupia wiesaeckerbachi]|uniref:type II secretion system protein GspL n=1 Tax=Jeongeupia wiesaeckerbachi TaxID=3051218 RepID=UPI003D804F95